MAELSALIRCRRRTGRQRQVSNAIASCLFSRSSSRIDPGNLVSSALTVAIRSIHVNFLTEKLFAPHRNECPFLTNYVSQMYDDIKK